MALWDIPQHSYYDSPKYKNLKSESAKCALDVSELLPAIVAKVSKELKAKDRNLYKDKIEEVNSLKVVSRDHYHSIVSRGPSSLKKNEVKKEILEVDGGYQSWLNFLDCVDGRMALNLCPPDHGQEPLAPVQEDDRSDPKKSTKVAEKKQGIVSGGQLPRDGLRNPYSVSIDFSRTVSAPAHIGKLPSHRRVDTERREPPPAVTEGEPPAFSEVQYHPETSKHNDIVVTECKSKEVMQYESDLERALYFSGLEFQATSQDTNNGMDSRYQHLKPVENDAVAFKTISRLYRDDFEDLRKNQVIKVSYLDTYQGRVKESVNGCTVIAPLLAIHHLCNDEQLIDRNKVLNERRESASVRSYEYRSNGFGTGIEDETIRLVIDTQAPLVLPRVRKKLGLPEGALIIPSDVHDFLIQENFLLSEQFAGVYGGNILDDGHLSQFVDYLSTFGNGVGCDDDTGEAVESRKIAATFFFHEHVVSLHRITRRISTSFRHTSTRKTTAKSGFFRKLRSRKNKNVPTDDITTTIREENTWFEIIDSLPGAAMLNNDEDREQQTTEECYSHLPVTARIRCNDKRSLHAALRWYACSKFTPDDQKFIDSYQWDDTNMEFDPRVFQSFVWSSV